MVNCKCNYCNYYNVSRKDDISLELLIKIIKNEVAAEIKNNKKVEYIAVCRYVYLDLKLNCYSMSLNINNEAISIILDEDLKDEPYYIYIG